MAEQRQPFRFRLPWMPAPQPTPASPRPSQASQAPPQPAPAQRPPFRPAGVAPSQPPPFTQPPSRAEPQPPSQSRVTSQPPGETRGPTPLRAPPASATRAASQTQVTSPARRVSPQSQTASQTARPTVSTTPPSVPAEVARMVQPEAKPQSPPKKPPSTMDTSQSQKQITKQETLEPSSEEGTKMLRGMNRDEPKEKKVADREVSQLKLEPQGQALAELDERGQHPSEEVFEQKEVLGSYRAETHTDRNERAGRIHHKTPMAGKEMKEGSRKLGHKLGASQDKHPLIEKPFSIITLTGENTGATMQLSPEQAKRERPIHIHRGYKAKPEESVEPTTAGEGSYEGRKSGDEQELATKLYVNNNAQGVNNSLVFNSSVTERNPGVHVAVSRNLADPMKPRKEREDVQTRRAEVASAPAERLAYAPTVRRRCLRGLFLESSDSDPENPEKPRRHGCRVGCDQKRNEESVNVL